jgi:hypothetical protein
MILNKKGEFNFVLLFAIFAGTIILLLAIYGAVKTGSTLTKQNEAELAKSLEIITDPLQAGFAEIATSKIIFKKETIISVSCNDFGGFGDNVVSVQTKSSTGEDWTVDPFRYTINNKYLFSDSTSGKTFYVFSEKFATGFNVADLLFITPRNFCFVFPPEEIAEKMAGIRATNIGVRLTNGNNTCKEDAEDVCFDSDGCDIIVTARCNQAQCESEYDFGIVTDADGTQIPYSGGLMFGAIFTDKDTYECNVKRLLYRASRIADVFSQKIDFMSARGCDSLMKPDLIAFTALLQNATSANLEEIYYASLNLDKKRKLDGGCALEW